MKGDVESGGCRPIRDYEEHISGTELEPRWTLTDRSTSLASARADRPACDYPPSNPDLTSERSPTKTPEVLEKRYKCV